MTSADVFRPSEYTALLIQALHLHAHLVRGADVFEVGIGSGVVLRAMAGLGAAKVSGTDIEPEAVRRGRALLADVPPQVIGSLAVGDMWDAAGQRRFDLIVSNLPHFPADTMDLPERLRSWSAGGPDGRTLLDRFLDGLDSHLAPGGHALLTHNAFTDLEQSRLRLAPAGLMVTPLVTTFVHLGGDKSRLLPAALLRRHIGRSLHQYGTYLFGEVSVVDVARAPVMTAA